MPARSASAKPVRKVTAATSGGAIVTIVTWALKQFAHIDLPPEVAAALATVVAFAFGYVTPPGQKEVVVTT